MPDQLFDELSKKILDGDLPVGEKLPTIRELADERGVSPATVQAAYKRLQAEGLTELPNGPRGGTTVAKRTTLTSGEYFRAGARQGRIYGNTGWVGKILSAEIVPAEEHVALALNLEPGTPVVRRQRVTVDADGTPVATSISYHPGELVDAAPLIAQLGRVPQGTPQYIAEQTGHVGVEVTEMVSARAATDEESDLLRIPKLSPVLVTRDVLRTADDFAVMYGYSVTPPKHEKVFRYAL